MTATARTFVRTSSQVLEAASAPLSGYPLTLAGWVRPASTTTAMTAMSLGMSSGSAYAALGMNGTSGAGVGFLENATDAIGPASALSVGTWGHLAGTISAAASGICYVNGVAGTPATIGGTFVPNRTDIGGLNTNNVIVSFFDGDIAECGVWNVVLTAAEIATLAKGASPTSVRPGNLVGYWRVTGDDSPELDTNVFVRRNLTVTGATKATTAPPVQAVAEDRDAPGTFGPSLPIGPPGLRFPSTSPILPNEPRPTRPLHQLHLTQSWNTAMQPENQAYFESYLDFMTGYQGTPQWTYYKAWNAPFLPVAGYINTFGEGTYTWPQQLDSDGATLYLPFGTPDPSTGAYERPSRDLRSAAYRNLFVDAAMVILGDGGEGIFLDDVNVDTSAMFKRAFGSATLTDFDSAAYYTSPITGYVGWVALLADFVVDVTKRIRDAKPTARFFFNTQWAWNLSGRWTDPRVARIIAAADYVTIEGGTADPNIYGGPGSNGGSDFAWRTLWSFIQFCHANNTSVVTFSRSGSYANRRYEMAHYHVTRDPLMRDMVGVWQDYDVWPNLDPVYSYDLGQRLTPSIDDGNYVTALYKNGIVSMIPGDMSSGRVVPQALRDNEISTDSPSAWWKFSNVELPLNDSIGTSNFTATGTPVYDGTGYTFPAGSSLSTPDAAALRLNASNWTLEFEVTAPNPLPAAGTFQAILSKGWATIGGWLIYWNGTNNVFDYWGGGASATATGTGVGLIAGETALVAVEYNNTSGQISFYKNGILVGGPLTYAANTESADPFRVNIANQGDAASGWRFGSITIFPTALTAQRLLYHYQGGALVADNLSFSPVDSAIFGESSSILITLGTAESGIVSDVSLVAPAVGANDSLTISDASGLATTLALAVSDAYVLADASSIAATLAASDIETLTELAGAVSAALATVDSGSFTDISTLLTTVGIAVFDSTTFAEAASALANALSTSDQGTFADVAIGLAVTLAATDSTLFGNLVTALATTLSATEARTLTEASAISNALSVVDSSAFTEAAGALANALATTDSSTFTDVVASLVRSLSAFDSTAVTDIVLSLAAAFAANDASSFTELSGLANAISTADSSTFTENTSGIAAALAGFDLSALAEAVALAVALSASEGVDFTDAATLTTQSLLSAADAFTYSELASILSESALSASDVMTLAETAGSLSAAVQALDSGDTSEGLTLLQAASDLNDSSALTDTFSALVASSSLIDSWIANENASTATEFLTTDSSVQADASTSTLLVSLTESLTVSEISALSAALTGLDIASFTDSIFSSGQQLLVNSSDAFAFSEFTAIQAETLVSALDALVLSESSSGIGAQLSASDSSAITDLIAALSATASVSDLLALGEVSVQLATSYAVFDSAAMGDISDLQALFTPSDVFAASDASSIDAALSLVDASGFAEAVELAASLVASDSELATELGMVTLQRAAFDLFVESATSALQEVLGSPPDLLLPTRALIQIIAAKAIIEKRQALIAMDEESRSVLISKSRGTVSVQPNKLSVDIDSRLTDIDHG